MSRRLFGRRPVPAPTASVVAPRGPPVSVNYVPRRVGTSSDVKPVFEFKGSVNWFPGHMAKSSQEMFDTVRHANMVVEAPLSTANDVLDRYLAPSKRLVVFNKIDLANAGVKQALSRHMDQKGIKHVFAAVKDGQGVTEIVEILKKECDTGFKIAGGLAMVAGIPNTGKSSLINAIRNKCKSEKLKRSHVAAAGALPGVTRHVKTIQVSENPVLFLMDTPGIMLPNVHSIDLGLKLALIGCVPDGVVSNMTLAQFFLHLCNHELKAENYVRVLGLDGPTDDVNVVLERVAAINHIGRPGSWDLDAAANRFIRGVRRCAFGRLTFDVIPPTK